MLTGMKVETDNNNNRTKMAVAHRLGGGAGNIIEAPLSHVWSEGGGCHHRKRTETPLSHIWSEGGGVTSRWGWLAVM